MDAQMTYKWTVPIYPVDAQTAGRKLEDIIRRRGALKPEYVVEESKRKAAVLHSCFEWNNKTAAERYRQRQAQHLIRNLVTVKLEGSKPPTPVRAFVSVRQNHEYVPVATALQSRELRGVMLHDALRELQSFVRKYAAMGTMMQTVGTLRASCQKKPPGFFCG